MRDRGFDQLPVLSSSHKLIGLITLGNCLSWISQGRASAETAVEDVMFDFRKIAEVPVVARDLERAMTTGKSSATSNQTSEEASLFSKGRGRPNRFVEITLDTPLKALSRFFEWNSAAVVTERDVSAGAGADGDGPVGGMRPVAVVTKVDLLTWLMRQGTANGGANGSGKDSNSTTA